MNVREILNELARLRISLQVENDALKVRGARGALTDSLRNELTARKPEIIAFLRQRENRTDQDEIKPVPRNGPMLLSVPQDWMWYWDQVDPSNSYLHLPFTTRVRGPMQVELLERAIANVVRRHETLHCVFHDEGSGPRMHLRDPQPVEVPVMDLRHLSPEARKPEAQRLLTTLFEQNFDLAQGPLFRFMLVRIQDDEHWLAGVFHHLISDMASTFLVQHEIFPSYEALATGRSATLPDLPIQYADYAAWQRRVLMGGERERLARYWRARLADTPPVVLPADRPRPKIPSRRGASAIFEVAAPLTQAVNEFCRAHRVSLFTLCVSLLNTLLHRCSGQTDVLLGCSINGRTGPALAPLLGNLGWDVGLRTDLQGDPTFGELVERVGRVVVEAMSHQELPVAELIRGTNRGPRETFDPYFKVMTTALVQPAAPAASGFDIEPLGLGLSRGTQYYDLFVVMVMTGSRFYFLYEYAMDLFAATTIESIHHATLGLLEKALQDPNLRLSALPMDEQLRANALAFEAPPINMTVTSTFTAEPLNAGLDFWSNELGLSWNVAYAGFGQVFQQLLDPTSALSRNRDGMNVVLVRLSDLGEDPAAREVAYDQLVRALSAVRVPVVLIFCPSLDETMAARETVLAKALEGAAGVYVTTSAQIAATYPLADVHDRESDSQGSIPYSPAYYAVLATVIVRRLHALKGRSRKVIVADCDNTLWDGVCGEVGPDGVELEPGHRALQEFLVAQHDQGTIVCLCSKNEEADVRAVFEERSDFPMRLEHIAAMRVNWRPKSQNLKALAQELNLGLDSFIFIDDNPIECAEVRANCPDVLVLPVASKAEGTAHALEHLWALDRLVVTQEDRQRTQFYQREADRARARSEAPSLAAFLERLEINIDIAPLAESQIPRVSQLTKRTNQFNTTTLRLSESDIAAYGPERCLVTTVRDRFGDHGLVGVTLLGQTDEALVVEDIMQSCRTLGRGVEHQMLSIVGQRAEASQKHWVDIPLVPSARNQPVRDFLEEVARDVPGSEFKNGVLRVDAKALAALRFDPSRATEAEPEQAEGGGSAKAAKRAAAEISADKLVHITRVFARPDDLAAAVEHRPRNQDQAARAPYVAPQSPAEQILAQIWTALLGIESIGAKDDFFDLGGDSVTAIQMVGRARNAGLVLSANDMLTHKSIEALAALGHSRRMEMA